MKTVTCNWLLEQFEGEDYRALVLRGASGSGKSSLAKWLGEKLHRPVLVASADSFFMNGDEYNFDPSKLKDAHRHSRLQFKRALESTFSVIPVSDNTNTTLWETLFYVYLCEVSGWKVTVLNMPLADRITLVERNRHGVPEQGIKAQLKRFEPLPDFLDVPEYRLDADDFRSEVIGQ